MDVVLRAGSPLCSRAVLKTGQSERLRVEVAPTYECVDGPSFSDQFGGLERANVAAAGLGLKRGGMTPLKRNCGVEKDWTVLSEPVELRPLRVSSSAATGVAGRAGCRPKQAAPEVLCVLSDPLATAW